MPLTDNQSRFASALLTYPMFRGGAWTPETALDNTAEALDDPQRADMVLTFFSTTPQYRGWTKDQIRNELDILINEVPQEEPKKPGLLQRAGEAISGAASAAQKAVSGAFQTPALPSPVSVPRQSPEIAPVSATQESTAQPIPAPQQIEQREMAEQFGPLAGAAVPKEARFQVTQPEQLATARVKEPNTEIVSNVPRRLVDSLKGNGVPGSAEWYYSLNDQDRETVNHYLPPVTQEALKNMKVGPLEAYGRAGMGALTFGAVGDKGAIAEARTQHPVAAGAGEVVGMVAPGLVGGTGVLKAALSIPRLAEIYQVSRAGKAAIDAAARIATTTADQVVRFRDDLASGDPERVKNARTMILTNAAASGASVAPEAFKTGVLKGWMQPLSQGIVDAMVTSAGMASGDMNAWDKDNAASSAASAILSALFGLNDMNIARKPTKPSQTGGEGGTRQPFGGDVPRQPPQLPSQEGASNAGTVRSDEAGVPDAGNVREGSQGQGSQNLQRNAQEGAAPGDEVRGVNQETLVTVRQPTIVIDKKTGLPDQNTVAKYKEEMPKEDWTISYDVDNFKSVNDQYGHAAGDKILGDVGAAAQKFFGSLPFNGREGGEEFFAHIGPDVGDSRKLANQFREYVAQNVKTPDGHPVTVSVGIGKGYFKSEDGQMHLVSDRAAYNSKSSGRNTVSVHAGVDNEGKISYDIDVGEPVKKPYVEEFAKKQGKEAADVLFKAGRIDEATKRRIVEGFDRGQEGAPAGGRDVQPQTPGEQRTGKAPVERLPEETKEYGRTQQQDLFGSRSDASAGGYNQEKLPTPPEQPTPQEGGPKRVLRLRGPAIVRLYQAMASGKVPAVVRKLRAAMGTALGMATPGSRSVRLRSDIWLGPELLRTKLPRNEEESAALVEEMRSLFAEQHGVPIEDIVFKKDGRNGVFYKRDHDYHEKIGAHEIMHVADYVPDDMRRGNILGHIASLKKFMGVWLDSAPNEIGQVITAEDKRNIRKALKEQGLKPNTQEWIDARDAALKEIADAKGLITKREVMEELKAVSQYVRPFDREANKDYTKYRDRASELYADAGGLLLNDPDKLKNMAPTFYNAFFAHMERKPELKTAYDEIQKQIESGEEIEVNQQNIRKMSEEGEAKLRKLRESGERKMPSVVKMLVEKNQAIYRSTEEAKRILKEKGIELDPNQDPIIQLGKYESVTGEEKAIVLKAVDVEKKLKDAGLTLQDAHEFMFEERNINDRKDIANPGDFTPEYSAEQLANLKRQLGEERFNKLSDIVNEYRDWRQQAIVDEYIASGMASPELAEKMKNNRQYASYLVNKYINSPPGTSGISREIHAAKGTLESIANTFTATVMRDRAIIRGLRRNNATRTLVETLGKVDETGATKEGRRFVQEAPFENGKPKDPDDPKLGLITYEEAGKEKGFWVEKDVAEAINRSKEDTDLSLAASRFIRIMGKLNFSKRFYVPWNVGFAMANIPRDWKRSVLNLPGNKIPFSQFVTILPKYLKAIPLAARAAAGRYDPEYTRMIKQGIIPTIEVRDRGYVEAPTHLEAMKREMQLAKEEKGISGVFHKIDATASFLSAMSEIISKTAGKRYLEAGKDKLFNPYTGKKGGWTEDQIAHFTRNFVGTPSTQRGGTASNVTNALALYSSVAIQGWRSDLSLYKTGLRRERLWKVGRSLAPKAIMMAGAAGLLGKAYQEMMDAIPENDKANYNTFPLGWTSNGKVKYLRLPDTEEMRAIGGTLWKAFRTGKMGPEALKEIPGVVLNYLGGLTPSLAPGVSLPADIVSFARGKNVEDKFRGEMAIPDKVWKATGPEGGYEREKAELKYLWNKYGPTVAYRFQGNRPSMGDTDLEKFLRLPGVSGTLGRFIKVSDRGISESNTEASAKAGAAAAKKSIDIDEAIIDALDTLGEKNEKPDRSSFNRIRRDLIESGVIDKRTDRARAWAAWQRWATLGIGSADARSLYQAATKPEREAIAKHILERDGLKEGSPEYRQRFRRMIKNSFVAREAIKGYGQ